jgi:tRNA pseudouridine13 synthase
MDALYYLDHSPTDVHFTKNQDDFVVEEIPLYPFSEDGEHLIIKIRKKNLTTWEMIEIFAKFFKINQKEIGYAGLKDKHGMTIQHISLLNKSAKNIENFSHESIKILATHRHKNKLKIGHLKGNRFFIRLKKVNKVDALKLSTISDKLSLSGIPNYFGYQRFGNERSNFEKGKELLQSPKKQQNRKKDKFLINAYQSHLFNLWLSKRVEMSKMCENFNIKELQSILNLPTNIIKNIKKQKQFFKLLPGDIAIHYPFGKAFLIDDIDSESQRFDQKEIVPTGLLCGNKCIKADGIAADIEKSFIDHELETLKNNNGSRRNAWIFPEDLEHQYIEEKAWFHINFTLPKGSYATVLLDELLHNKK